MSETEATKSLTCPKCSNPMRRLKAGTVEVDRCESCFGVWLDKGEGRKLLKDKALVAGLDIGTDAVGQEQDKVVDIECPRCGSAMRHIKNYAQSHVGFEQCTSCEGCFFDAGELSDLSEFTLAERIKAFFGR